MAKKTGALREVFISEPRLPLACLQLLAKGNPHLETLCFETCAIEGPSLYITDIISSFGGLKNLRSLAASSSMIFMGADSPEIRDACVILRGRNVSVRLNDTEYSMS